MSPELLARCLEATLPRAVMWSRYLTSSMEEFEINTPVRQAAYMAQIGHESLGLRYMAEMWGPTEAQERYEPPSSLATRLGNTEPGDGRRFSGRGPIQCTGRFNYRKYGKLLNLELEQFPELLDDPSNACRVAACFWKTNGLNELADTDQFTLITKRINGGTNGLVDRKRRWEIAKNVLGAFA